MGNKRSKVGSNLPEDVPLTHPITCHQHPPQPSDTIHTQAMAVRDVTEYDFPFENLVFQGGGIKAVAYAGAIRTLEKVGLSKASGQIKRVCGSSAGAVTALLYAIGYNSYEIETILSTEMNKLFNDHRFGCLSFLPNLFDSFGWNSGRKVYKWAGKKIENKLGDPDVTFSEFMSLTGIELCVIAVNINQMNVEYFHPKTAPDMPVRLAVKMTLSFPLLMTPTPYHHQSTHHDLFLDGGMLCNYPIHAFDGWWLSMKAEDGFFRRLHSVSEMMASMEHSTRFGIYNDKTLGFVLYRADEDDLYRSQLENRRGTEIVFADLPETRLAKSFKEKAVLDDACVRDYDVIIHAIDSLLAAFAKYDTNDDQQISLDEFCAVLNDSAVLSCEDRDILFSQNVKTKKIFQDMAGGDKQITFPDLTQYLERRGLRVQNEVMGYMRREIPSLLAFLKRLQTSYANHGQRVFMDQRDVTRTVGIHTGHVDTFDFDLVKEDVAFLTYRGQTSTESFLKYYVVWNELQPRDSDNKPNIPS